MLSSTPDTDLIYVIEDDSTTATITRILLEKALTNSRVQLYGNGQQALDHLTAARQHSTASMPSLILLDLNMPLMDGWEFLDACNHLTVGEPVCIMVLTSSINPEDRARAAGYQNVAGFFSKPLDARTIERILRLRRSASGPTQRTAAGTEATLHHLMYQSRATAPMGDAELTQLLTQSRAFNAAHNLTGILLYSQGNIIQLLEGPETGVRTVFTRIVRDARHTGIIKLADGPVGQRLFAQWTMGFRTATPTDFATFLGYINPEHTERLSLNDPDLQDLLVTFATA
ncbi:BLUF domain-containing protein [Hymenobacter aerilatus]|uniref:BLUF domain-containing protein n=1 Tax=Hymenobacter aerilatus TaxID=2932251 RepID=A0A8T9SZY6_9BACT|nr:BLUF domain-containing protein [Hymenobacter aerilatus]UOR06931.1 BLUF domain-containing protein [Hymenobacter aerilatus]